MKTWGIYKIENLMNHKVYYGSSTNLKKRLREHKCELRKNTHVNVHLQNAWNLYGENAFTFDVVEEFSEGEIDNRELRKKETFYIQENKTYIDEFGYNNIPGGIGTLNLPCSEDKRKKISESNKGKIAWNKNIPMPVEQKELLTKVKTEKYGKKIDIYSPDGMFIETLSSVRETNRKYKCGRNVITDSCKGITLPKNWKFVYDGDSLDNIGCNRRTETEEEKQIRKIEYRNKRGTKVDIYTITGDFIKTVPSISAASEFTKQSETTIRNILHGTQSPLKYIYKYHGKKTINSFIKRNTCHNGDFIYNVYLNNIKVFTSKFKKDIVNYLLEYRKKNYLEKLMHEITFEAPVKEYKNYVIKLEPALS
jgi:group I intron endonuclease